MGKTNHKFSPKMSATTILAYLFDLASLVGFAFIVYQAKDVPYLITAGIVILMICCYPAVIQEHYKVSPHGLPK